MNYDQSYSDEQFSETDKSLSFDQTVTLEAGYNWQIILWGATVTAAANYTPDYYEYEPGLDSPNIVFENIQLINSDLSSIEGFVVMSSANFTKSYMDSTGEQIAEDYMAFSGPFANITAERGVRRGLRGARG